VPQDEMLWVCELGHALLMRQSPATQMDESCLTCFQGIT
jgi:hypothetical protein